MLDSSASTTWVLRATRRLKSLGSPQAVSNGKTVIASAPPTAAAKVEMVPRRIFTYGSSRVISRQEVTASWRAPRLSAETPKTSPIRAQHIRKARNRPMVATSSVVAETRKLIASKASSTLMPCSASDRTYSTPVASSQAVSCTSPAPAL